MTETKRMQIQVLGPIQVSLRTPIELSRPATRRLLAILALDAGRHISTDSLMSRFWPNDPPATAKASLQTHMSSLRKAVGQGVILTEGQGYRLDTDSVLIDSDMFSDLARKVGNAASSRSWPQVLQTADEALALWRGAPYPELFDDDFARPTIVGLVETHLELLEMRIEALLELHRPEDALPELESLTVEYPLRERLWEHLMTARYRRGRHTEALDAYRQVSEQLAQIGLEPGERLQRLEERVLLHDNTLTDTRNNLPVELSSFVGRVQAVENIGELLMEHRLVTLTGPGGSGKTRLALRVARDTIDRFPDGIWVADLASTNDPGLVPTEIALAMGLKPEGAEAVDAVVAALGDNNALVVLDNCEHLVEGAATTAQRLLRESSDVRLLATSREPLRVPGESIYEVPGLEYPSASNEQLRKTADFEAVQLFTQRASTADSTFTLTDANLAAVLRVCERLEGMPLALELAAARVRSLDVPTIAERLDDQLGLLTRGASTAPPRQQTLQATIEWSYLLLEPEERTVLNRLGVYRGAFRLDSAEQVTSSPDLPGRTIAATISDLVEKSLLATKQTDAGITYRLPETVRQYALLQLEESGETPIVEENHMDWYLGTLDGLWQRAIGSDAATLIGELEAESDNLQAALETATRLQNREATIALSQAIAWHWYFSGHLGTAIDILRSALDLADDQAEVALMRSLLARALAYSEDVDAAIVEAEAAKNVISELDAPLLKAWVLSTVQLGLFMSVRADPASMLGLTAAADEIASTQGDVFAEILARQTMADAYCWNGLTQDGLAQQRLAIELAEETGDLLTIDRTYGLSIYNFMLDPESRRTSPMAATRRWLSVVRPGPQSVMSTATDWLPWIYMQAGEFPNADEAVSWLGNRFLEGYNRSIYLMVSSSLAWMRGNLKEARRLVEELAVIGVSERWAHVYYPLAADIAADQGRLEEVREIAAEYLSLDVHPTGQAAKLGVLNPLVRAEVDAAIEGVFDEHEALAGQAFEKMQRILDDTPPLTEAWTSVMTHSQNLAFAEAELSRLSESSPHFWAVGADLADYAYYRLYARWRMAEALLRTGESEAGTIILGEVDEEVATMGAQLMRTRVKRTGREFQIL